MVFALLAGVVALGRQSIADLEASAKRRPSAATYRALADAYVAAGEFQKASDAFSKAATLYGKLGDPNASKVLSLLAGRYRTSIGIFEDAPPKESGELARFEPISGCYLGANIEREDATRDPATFNQRIGKHHAIFFMYRQYGVPFPKEYARTLRSAGSGLQLAFEPRRLEDVQDDRYLRQFAEDARRSNIPIFLRYASEMNGDWTPYHSDPELYIQKFRLVAKVMHEDAPNVAMVWCPNEIPEEPIPRYYPGVDAVDWVGVNFYSVIFNDANRARSAEWKRPEDALSYVYERYAARHPIMVGEWAASHRSIVDGRPRPDFARTKIAQFYSSIPMLYPRVKAVSWLSFNTFKYASGERQLNNYSLFDLPEVAEAYRQQVDSPYFLEKVQTGISAAIRPLRVTNGARIRAGRSLRAYIRSYEPTPSVTFTFDRQVVSRSSGPGPYVFEIPDAAASGLHALGVEVKDASGRLAGNTNLSVLVER